MACDDNEAAARYRPTMADDPFSPDTLPLFPLGSVLFPGGLLPLQVFEVRYLDMIGRCHRAGQPFGVVALAQVLGHADRRVGWQQAEAGHPQAVLELAGLLDAKALFAAALDQQQPGLGLFEPGDARQRADGVQ